MTQRWLTDDLKVALLNQADWTNDEADDVAKDLLDARAEIAALRAALKRCHDLLQEAEAFTDCDVQWKWGAAVVAELLACDEAGECPAIAAAREEKP